ncbi:MAG: cobalt transport protein CbiM [Methanocella sp. PtaU1.Bin125]|nr:MAG: cobalt transport protein CbiM [Methanocella sp. PtaU1.Bin125]
MDKKLRNLLIGLAALIILVPLGLLAEGETYGEWANDWLQEELGYVPQGLEQMSSLWSAPMPDYSLPLLGDTFSGMSVGYILSAIVGVALCGGILYFGGRVLVKNKD